MTLGRWLSDNRLSVKWTGDWWQLHDKWKRTAVWTPDRQRAFCASSLANLVKDLKQHSEVIVWSQAIFTSRTISVPPDLEVGDVA